MGYSADVEVILDVRHRMLRVPASALLPGGGRVLVLDADHRLVERRVKTGLANWEHAEVLEGLSGGERIVTSLDRAGSNALASVEDAASAIGAMAAAPKSAPRRGADRALRHRAGVPPRREHGARAGRREPAHRAGRIRRGDGAVGLWQVDAAQRARLLDRPDAGHYGSRAAT